MALTSSDLDLLLGRTQRTEDIVDALARRRLLPRPDATGIFGPATRGPAFIDRWAAGLGSALESGHHLRGLSGRRAHGPGRPSGRPAAQAGLARLPPPPAGGDGGAARAVLGLAIDRTPSDRGPHPDRLRRRAAARGRPAPTRLGGAAGWPQLEGWAAFPNGTFWVLPIAGALIGPTGTAIAALTNAVYAIPNALCIHLMRRDAPIRQRRSTELARPVDGAGRVPRPGLLHASGPAPAASKWILTVSGPLLAFVGAALYTGSGAPPAQRLGGKDRFGVPPVAAPHRRAHRLPGRSSPWSPDPPPSPSSPCCRRSGPRPSTRPSRPCSTATGPGW